MICGGATVQKAMLCAAFAGLFAAAILSAGHLLDVPAPCGKSHGCITVAAHPASKVLGVPVAYFGVAAYLLIVGLIVRGADSRTVRHALFGLTGVGAIASAGLLIYSQAVIHATCPWCLASGAAMAILFGLSYFLVRSRHRMAPVSPAFLWSLAVVTSAGIGLQAGYMQRAANAPPIPAGRLAEVSAEDLVDPAKSLGPPDAAVTIVVFTDLACPACRAAHASLLSYQQAHPESVRLVYRHHPLWDIRGHELSGAAAALSEIAAEQGRFWPFVNSVHGQRHLLNRAGYLSLLGKLQIEADEAEERIQQADDPAVARVWNDVHLAERLGVTSTPTFIVLFGDNPPVSANQRTLPRILNSPAVITQLLAARR